MTKKNEETTAEATEVKEELAEVKEEAAEVKEEAAAARSAGDTDRAERLEAKLDSLTDTMGKLGEKLDSLISRPFHPAPEERPSDAGTSDTDTGKGAAEHTNTSADSEPDETPKKRRTASRGWFGARAEED